MGGTGKGSPARSTGDEGRRETQLQDAVYQSVAQVVGRQWDQVGHLTRVFICSAATARTLHVLSQATPDARPARTSFTVVALLSMAAFLGASLVVCRLRSRTAAVHLSVALDSVCTLAALLTNVLLPWPGYPGLINMPDLASLLCVTLGAGFRLSARAALLGAIINSAGFVGLVAADWYLWGPSLAMHRSYVASASFWASFLAAASVAAVWISLRNRELVAVSVRAAMRADEARRNLGALLSEHHDVRSLLSAAQVQAGAVVQHLVHLTTASRPALDEVVAHLQDDLRQVEERINTIKVLAYADLMAFEEKLAIEVVPVVEEVLALVGPRFPGVILRANAEARPWALVAGGTAGLLRILSNLLVNACEGDGVRGATTVELTVRAEPDAVLIEVSDDGPGFSPELLKADPAPLSTKATGTGVGLALVAAVVRASAGSLRRANLRSDGTDRGGRVQLRLPIAAPATRRR